MQPLAFPLSYQRTTSFCDRFRQPFGLDSFFDSSIVLGANKKNEDEDETMKKIPQDNIEMVVDGLLTAYTLENCLNAIKNHDESEIIDIIEKIDNTKQILPDLKNLQHSRDEKGYYHLECSDGELKMDSFQFLSIALINDNLMLFQKYFKKVIKELLGKAYRFKKGVEYKIDKVKDVILIKHDHGIIKISHETGGYTITNWDKPFSIS